MIHFSFFIQIDNKLQILLLNLQQQLDKLTMFTTFDSTSSITNPLQIQITEYVSIVLTASPLHDLRLSPLNHHNRTGKSLRRHS
jgi:hypothetical protein